MASNINVRWLACQLAPSIDGVMLLSFGGLLQHHVDAGLQSWDWSKPCMASIRSMLVGDAAYVWMVGNVVPTFVVEAVFAQSPRRRFIMEQVGCSGRQLACALVSVEAQFARWCVVATMWSGHVQQRTLL